MTIGFVPNVMPISDLRHKQAQVVNYLTDAPILLTQHGKAVAVMVAPAQWNRLLELLETLDDTVDGLEAKLDLLTGADETVNWATAKAELSAVSA